MNRFTSEDVSTIRLTNLLVSSPTAGTPANVVAHLGALQAQDHPGALWAIGLRSQNTVTASIEQAIVDRTIVRTWPMRGTLHYVPGADIHWMLELCTRRPIATAAQRRDFLRLKSSDFDRSEAAFAIALQGGKQLLRDDMYRVMAEAGVDASGQRGVHVLRHFAMTGLLCFGSHEGKQPSFALLDEWAPNRKLITRNEALAELAKRYFLSHGPATVDDFVRWSGLSVGECRTGINAVSSLLRCDIIEAKTYWAPLDTDVFQNKSRAAYLLPGFDEFMLGYKDRSAALDSDHTDAICPGGNGMFIPTIVINGKVIGTWSRTIKKNKTQIVLKPFERLSELELDAVSSAGDRYSRFISSPTEVIYPH